MDAKSTKPSFMLVFIMLCLFPKTHTSLKTDTISANQSLSGDQTIVSASGKFVFGFFKPGNSSNYYIGTWFKKDPAKTILWVANRQKPVADKLSFHLRISDGNLVLFIDSQIPIWSTNIKSKTSSSVQAILLDNGNLILNDESNSSKLLWQSVDYLTNTFLYDSKLGYNKRTKRKKSLTSWKNSEDPSSGHFSFELDLSDISLIILYNSSRIYWRSGPWDGKSFSLVPGMRPNSICYFKLVSDDNGSYLIHSLFNASTISQLRLDVSGQLQARLWTPTIGWKLLWSFPRQQCEVYAFCGPYGSCNENSLPFCRCLLGFEPKSQSEWDLMDYSSGCLRKSKLQCGNVSVADGDRDRFLEIRSMSLPENEESIIVDSVADCESTCLNNCSCTAYAYNNNGCSIWVGDLLNMQQLKVGDSSGRTLYIRLAASEFQTQKKARRLDVGVVVGSSAGLLAALFLGLIFFLILRRRKKRVGARKALLANSLVIFGYRDLQNATKNFSETLGRGGFGSVFKGILPNSTPIAVKKLESVGQGEKEFRTEVGTIGTIQHVNLVRLRGFCSQGTKRLLVYDYMSNGSLASHLFDNNKSKVLNWKTRYHIALGTARGLFYLHEKCRDCIIHCDIKPENVLLDAEFCPKVADFGLAKLVGREFSRVLTTMRGTRGYLAPEWILGVAITSKADVYSYGMMLFEFISGRRNSDQLEIDGKIKYFPSFVASQVVNGGDLLGLLDRNLQANANVEEVERLCKVACWCIQDDEAQRPSMSQVVQFLEGLLQVTMPPVPRSLYIFDDNEDNMILFTDLSSSQSSRVKSDASTDSSQAKSATSLMCRSPRVLN